MASLHPGPSDLVTVGATVLRVHGAGAWTGPASHGGVDRTVELTNCGDTLPVYVGRVAVGSTLAGSVSPSRFSARIEPGEGPLNVFVPAGYDLAVVSAAPGTPVLASSFVEVE